MNFTRFGFRVAIGLSAFVLTALPLAAQGPAARKLEVSFNNGLVTIQAENVTVREILQEWSRKGGSRIVNADKLGGSVVPFLEFRDQPEVAVLRSLLRDVPGYGAAPRIAPAAGASTIDAVFILATRTVPVSGAPAAAPPVQQQTGQPNITPPPQPAPQVINGSPDMELPPVRPVPGDTPPSTPGGSPTANNPTLRTGPGGTVTSTVPGVVIPGPATTPPGTATPPTGGRGRGGGGGGGA